jgi:hypothetical protein
MPGRPSVRPHRAPHCPGCDAPRTRPPFSRAQRGQGSKRELSPGVWKLTVSAGRDEHRAIKRAYRTVPGSEADANRALASLVTEVGHGDRVPSSRTEEGPSPTSSSISLRTFNKTRAASIRPSCGIGGSFRVDPTSHRSSTPRTSPSYRHRTTSRPDATERRESQFDPPDPDAAQGRLPVGPAQPMGQPGPHYRHRGSTQHQAGPRGRAA